MLQFYILKLHTSRLKKDNWNIRITPDEARTNGELVSIGDSQMLRTLRYVKGNEVSRKEVDTLLANKKKLNRRINKQSKQDFLKVVSELDGVLFVPEIISLVVDDNRHYAYLGKNGFFVNDVKYVRFLCGAGHSRRNTSFFIAQSYEHVVKKLLNNNRSDILLNPNKFNAYFALASSASYSVSTPRFCVVPDCEIKRFERVDFVEEIGDENDLISEQDKEITFNLWDGQGLISPQQSKIWADELEVDYIPSNYIIRANFIKGMLVTFDFHKFAKEIAHQSIIKDVWGKEVNISDVDVILTASQFKLWEAYPDFALYLDSSKNYCLGWGVSRIAPENESNYCFSNYQFVQVLDLDDEDVAALCQDTVSYFEKITKLDVAHTLIYLLGSHTKKYDNHILDKIDDPVAKALMLNHDLIHDPYIKTHLLRSINKKIKESYIGKLLVHGFYTTMIADPYAFCEYIFGMEIKGLLNRCEHYNRYWVEKQDTKIAAMRSPLTWRSEVNVLNMKVSPEIEDWYHYIQTGCVFNVHGIDTLLAADSDFDGDLVCLTNNKQFVEKSYGGLPINYTNKKAPKVKIVESELYLADMKSFNTKVGFVTNISTTMYSMLPRYSDSSLEYKELIRRLKQCRKEQGSTIDAAKGLIVKPFPKHWTNWQKAKDESEQELVDFRNSILVDKRPFFMIYLYPDYYKEGRKYDGNYNNYCNTVFGCDLKSLLARTDLSKEEAEIVGKYHKYHPFIDTNCTINNVCHYMEKKSKLLEESLSRTSQESDVYPLVKQGLAIDKEKLKKLYMIYKEYKANRRNFGSSDVGEEILYNTVEQYNKYILKKSLDVVSEDIQELASLAIVICYEMYPSDNKSFAWNVFSEGIIKNIRENHQEKILMPVEDRLGDIEFLYSKYSMVEVEI